MTTAAFRPDLDKRGIGKTVPHAAKPIHQLFEETARRIPNARAIVYGDDACTYGDLDARATAFAEALMTSGHPANTVVAVSMPRGIDLIAALIGAQKAGVPYLPIDPDFPANRVDYMLADSAATTVIADAREAAAWHGRIARVISTAEVPHRPSAPEGQTIWRPVSLDATMYLIYTSGTTGRPKGIAQTYRTVSNLIQWQNTASGIAFGGRTLQFASFGFDVYLQEVFSPLTSGGTVCLISETDRLSPSAIADCIRRHDISVLFLSVSVMSALFDDPARLPDGLTDIITAGEPLVISPRLRGYLEDHPHLRLHNHYGVSESHVVTQSSYSATTTLVDHPTLGRPIDNVRIAVLGEDGMPTHGEDIGEIWIAGDCLATGYINLPDKTAALFHRIDGRMWYRTGDFGGFLSSGELRFVGRRDDQVKISGHLVVISEVEAAILRHPSVKACACTVLGGGGDQSLVAHVLPHGALDINALRAHLATELPPFQIPSRIVPRRDMPIGPTGKIDRARLTVPRAIDRATMTTAHAPARDPVEEAILAALSEACGLDGIGMDDTFPSLGLSSFKMIRAAHALGARLGRTVDAVRFFECDTPRTLKAALTRDVAGKAQDPHPAAAPAQGPAPIAIIGMAGLFPGASSVDVLWNRLHDGGTLLTRADPSARREASGLVPDAPATARWFGPIDGFDRFEAGLFALSEHDALWMDPQHRKFLEQCWVCFEDAGLDPTDMDRHIGVFAGSAESAYLFHVQPFIETSLDYLSAVVGSDKDFLASRAAYHFGLTGPAVTVQSACSTGLLAVHQACEAIRAGACSMALAGASSILMPQERDLPYVEDAIFSADGLTRPFDIRRSGTTMTNAVAVVLLKPLDAALRDNDPIRAVIRGTAANNDGNRKAGFSAPSIDGQTDAVRAALSQAGLTPADLSFIETHGTATALGDRVEIEALRRVFGPDAPARACALTSVKSRLGHGNRAAGLVGLIAAALSLNNRTVLPMGHFTAEDPDLGLDASPFHVPIAAQALDAREPCRAGVSAFGIGGTNVHVVLETPPPRPAPPSAAQPELILLSGRGPDDLAHQARALADQCEATSIPLQTIARTLAVGRRPHPFRDAVVATSPRDLAGQLRRFSPTVAAMADTPPKIAFLCPGVGPEHLGMGQDLFARNAVFRYVVEDGCRFLKDTFGDDLLPVFTVPGCTTDLRPSHISHPLLLLVEVATGRALMDLGVTPDLMLGLSGGEFACAVLAEDFKLHDALALVRERGRLMDTLSIDGAALSVGGTVPEVTPYLTEDVHVAGVLSRRHVLLAGPRAAVEATAVRLERDEYDIKRLINPNPNHTPLMRGAADALAVSPAMPPCLPRRLPYVSGMTGATLPAGASHSPAYWADHMVAPVRFAEGLERLVAEGCTLFLELGPRDTASQLARAHLPGRTDLIFLPVLEARRESASFAEALGAVWRAGRSLDRGKLTARSVTRCNGLPGLRLHGARYWLPWPREAGAPSPAPKTAQPARALSAADRIWLRHLDPLPVPPPASCSEIAEVARRWAVIGNGPAARTMADLLETSPGTQALQLSISGEVPEDLPPHVVIIGDEGSPRDRFAAVCRWLSVLAGRHETACALLVSFAATGEDAFVPDAAFASAATVAPMEETGLTVRHVTFDTAAPAALWPHALCDEILDAVSAPTSTTTPIVYQGRRRMTERMVARPTSSAPPPALFRESDVVLITGGAGAVGRALSLELARRYRCRIVLIGRTVLETTDPRGERLTAHLAAITQAGGEGMYLAADIADPQDTARQIDAVIKRWGRLDAVLHLAAAIEDDRFLAFLPTITDHDIAHQCRPKSGGLRALDLALAALPTAPRRVAFSSIAVALGGLGYGIYTFSNRDMLAEARRTGWSVLHWDVWKAATTTSLSNDRVRLGSSLKGGGLNAADACDALARCLFDGLSEAAIFHHAPDARPAVAVPEPPSPDIGDASETSALHETVRAVWQRRLAVETLPPDADFLTYGGDSLSAIRIVMDLRKALNMHIGPDVLLRTPRLDAFVTALGALRTTQRKPETPAPSPLRSTYRASPLQTRWFHMHAEGYGTLVMPMMVHGAIDHTRLRDAVNSALRRFDILRTVYHQDTAGNVTATVLPKDRAPVLQTPSINGADEAALSAWTEALEDSPVSLSEAPPFQGWMIPCGADRVLLVFLTHHIAFDGWSAGLLADAIRDAYENAASSPGDPAYAAVAGAAWAYLDSPEATALRDRWRTVFEGSGAPTRPRPDRDGNTADKVAHKVHAVIAPAEVRHLRATAASAGTTMFGLLLGAFATMLGHSAASDDVVFGTTSSGRSGPLAENTVGVFVNPLPLRFRLSPDASPATILNQAREANALVLASMRYPVTDLTRTVQPFPQRPMNDAFTAYFLHQNFRKPEPWRTCEAVIGEPDDHCEAPYLKLFSSHETTLMRHFEIITFEHENGSLSVNIWGRKSLYSRHRLKELRALFLSRIRWLACDGLETGGTITKSLENYDG